jgi:peptide/nickel transport system substrate-binding protein
VPASFAFNPDLRVPERDVARARRLMQEAGHPRLTVEMQVANNPVQQQIAQMIQAMAGEAGIDIRIRATEFATLIREQNAGRFQVSFVGWSGRVDPDGNANLFWATGGAQNDGRYSNAEVDRLLGEARQISDTAARRRLYDQAQRIVQEDMPIIYLYYQPWFWAMNRRLEGFTPVPDGMIRLEGVRMAR